MIACVCLGVGEAAAAVGLAGVLAGLWRRWQARRNARLVEELAELAEAEGERTGWY